MFNPSEIPWQKPQILHCGIDWNGWLFRIFQEDFAKTKMLLRTKVRIDILLLHSYIKISTFKDLFSTLTNILNIYWQIYWQILVFFVAKHKGEFCEYQISFSKVAERDGKVNNFITRANLGFGSGASTSIFKVVLRNVKFSRCGHSMLLCKLVVLETFAKFKGNHLRWSSFLVKMQGTK